MSEPVGFHISGHASYPGPDGFRDTVYRCCARFIEHFGRHPNQNEVDMLIHATARYFNVHDHLPPRHRN